MSFDRFSRYCWSIFELRLNALMVHKLYRHFQRRYQRWRRYRRLPGWVALPRAPNLSKEAFLEGLPGFLELRPAAWSHSSLPWPVALPFLSRSERAWRTVKSRRIPALGCFVRSNAICGGEGYVYESDQLGWDPLTVPWEWRQRIREVPEEVPLLNNSSPIKRVDRTLLWFISRDYNSYGHWWLDLIPRLYLLHRDHSAWLDWRQGN